jgi:hypothetical protein
VKFRAGVIGGLFALGIALIVVGLIVGKPEVGIEGAYFNRSVGAPAYSGIVLRSGPGLFDPADGNLWMGAGVAVLGATVVSLVLVRVNGRHPLPG